MSLVRIKKLKITLKTKSPIRIGGSGNPFKGTDNPVISINGKYTIPGSSLKGAIRNKLEEYFIDLYAKTNKTTFQPCIPSNNPSNSERSLIGKKYRGANCVFKEDTNIEICPVCYFLGAQSLPGFVRVPFLWFETNVDSEVLTNISIDRATKTTRKGAILRSEIIPQDSTFSGILEIIEKDDILGWEFGKPRTINGINVDKWLGELDNSISPLEILKKVIQDIKILGGYKSKGFGDVEINIEEI